MAALGKSAFGAEVFWVGLLIFLSVGTQLPFDRLVRTVDIWAERTRRSDIVAQVGLSSYTPRVIRCFDFLGPAEIRVLQAEASVLVAHAGTGSILAALEFGKPIIVLPRDHLRGEHRNAHQLATAGRFRDMLGVYVAQNETELVDLLDQSHDLIGSTERSDTAPQHLITRLQSFVSENPPRRAGLMRMFPFQPKVRQSDER